MTAIREQFIVPAYYGDFRCKGGACRHTCCGGLAVNISEEEYFRLVGLPCSAGLRSDLDIALKPLRDADPYRYAAICPDFFGRCRLLDQSEEAGRKGLCRLQEECGEAALSATCRYFPRSPHFTGGGRCAMANACEETLELLFSMKEWKTTELPLSFDLAGRVQVDHSEAAWQRLETHKAQLERMVCAAETILSDAGDSRVFSAKEADAGKRKIPVADPVFVREHLGQLLRLLDWAADNYDSARPYCEIALLRCLDWTGNSAEAGSGTETETAEEAGSRTETKIKTVGETESGRDSGRKFERDSGRKFERDSGRDSGRAGDIGISGTWFAGAIAGVQAHYPTFDRFFFLTLINDLFWRFYPFTGKDIDPSQAEAVLPYMTGMLLLLCAANLNETSTQEELIDLFAAFYRMVELTPFDHNCFALLCTAQDVGCEEG